MNTPTARFFASCAFVSIVLFSQPAFSDVDFQRDVQPILAEHCWHCHGADAEDRRGGLRLDVQDSAFKGGESGVAAIVPGKPDESELIRRVMTHDADLIMPPPDQKKPVSELQIQTLKQWVTEGAKYQAHWAFTPPTKTPLPNVAAKNPIDAFVMSRLQTEGLTPSSNN